MRIDGSNMASGQPVVERPARAADSSAVVSGDEAASTGMASGAGGYVMPVPHMAEGGFGSESRGNRDDQALIDRSIKQANKELGNVNRRIEMSVHEVTHAVMYTIKDTRTNEVIGEFPPKKIEDMIAKMWELAGLFVDEKL